MIRQSPDTYKCIIEFLHLQDVERMSEVCKFMETSNKHLITKKWDKISEDLFGVKQRKDICVDIFNNLIPKDISQTGNVCEFEISAMDQLQEILFIDIKENVISPLMSRFLDMIVIYTHVLTTSIPGQKYYIANCDYINKEIKFINLRTLLVGAFFHFPCYGEFVKVIDKNTLLDDYINVKFKEKFKKIESNEIYSIDKDCKQILTSYVQLTEDAELNYRRDFERQYDGDDFNEIDENIILDKDKITTIVDNNSSRPSFGIMSNLKEVNVHVSYSCNDRCGGKQTCKNNMCECEGCLITNGQIEYDDDPNVAEFINCLTCLFDFNKFNVDKKIDDVDDNELTIDIECKYAKKSETLNHASYYQTHYLSTLYKEGTIAIENKEMDEIFIKIQRSRNKIMIKTSYSNIKVL